MTSDARTPWQTPALEPLTDLDATADRTAPVRNGNPGSLQITT